MANFEAKEIDLSNINGGQRYQNGDLVDAEAINAPIEASAWAQQVAQDAKILAEAASGMDTEAFYEAIRSIAAPLHKVMFFDDADINPASIYGGFWLRIKDAFLWASGDTESITYTENGVIVTKSLAVGGKGGEVTHTLTVNEMPRHNHDILRDVGNEPLYTKDGIVQAETTGGWYRGITFDGSGNDGSIISTYTGGSVAHNNMPPYYAVNAWVRVTEEEFNANESL